MLSKIKKSETTSDIILTIATYVLLKRWNKKGIITGMIYGEFFHINSSGYPLMEILKQVIDRYQKRK